MAKIRPRVGPHSQRGILARRVARAALTCQHCGTHLAAQRRSRAYCSPAGRQAAYRARRATGTPE